MGGPDDMAPATTAARPPPPAARPRAGPGPPAGPPAWPSRSASIRCTDPMNAPRPPPTMPARRRRVVMSLLTSRPVCLAAHPLDRDALTREHPLPQRVHRRGGFVDGLGEGERAFQNRRELLTVLHA